MMTSREQFGKWVREETGFDLWRTEYPMTEWDDQQYKCHQTNLAWIAWQASRAAIEVATPWLCGDGDNDNEWTQGYNDGVMATEKAIISAGLKVKK